MKGVEYEFTCPAAPVQAEGTINGVPFYFRARNEIWSFAVAERSIQHPASISSIEDGFYLEGTYGKSSFDASFMPLGDASRIIEDCAKLFLKRTK